MHVEPYNPRIHEPLLQYWVECMGLPALDPGVLSSRGFVAVDANKQPMAVLFAYRDPSSAVAFLDNLLVSPHRRPFEYVAALRALTRELVEGLGKEGVRFLFFATENRFVQGALARFGMKPIARCPAYFQIRTA